MVKHGKTSQITRTLKMGTLNRENEILITLRLNMDQDNQDNKPNTQLSISYRYFGWLTYNRMID